MDIMFRLDTEDGYLGLRDISNLLLNKIIKNIWRTDEILLRTNKRRDICLRSSVI